MSALRELCDTFQFLRLLRFFAANLPTVQTPDHADSADKKSASVLSVSSCKIRPPTARLLLPLCPRSVVSVTQSDSVFLRLLRFFAANFPNLFTADHADIADKKSASVLSVPSCKIRLPSALRRQPSAVRLPPSFVSPPALRSLRFLLFKSFRPPSSVVRPQPSAFGGTAKPKPANAPSTS